MKDLCNLKLPG